MRPKKSSSPLAPWQVAVLTTSLMAGVIADLTVSRTPGWEALGPFMELSYLVPVSLTALWWGPPQAAGLAALLAGFVYLHCQECPPSQPVWLLVAGVGIALAANGRDRMVAGYEQEMARLRTEAVTDELTGLLNWRRFKHVLSHQIRQFPGHPVSLAMVDLDWFKRYNDSLGHPAGDKLLVEVARVIEAAVPPTATVFRYGGEEFAILMRDTGLGPATEIAETVRSRVAQHSFGGKTEHPGSHITVSIGVAAFPIHAQYPEQLIERADEALYAAKRAGRNRVQAYGIT